MDSAALARAKKEFEQRAEAAGRPEPYIPEGTLPTTDGRSAPAFVREHRLRVLDGSGGSPHAAGIADRKWD
jgi:hypothetical protein